MADLEYVYVSARVSADELGALLSGELGLEKVFAREGEQVQLLGPTPGSEGATTELWIEPNEAIPAGSEPGDATAAYSEEISVRVYGALERQEDEARRVFDSLRAARPDWPLLLTHESVTALVAYLPGLGVREFDPPVEVDVSAADAWARWVPDPRLRSWTG
jgi:hypothetical protein